MGYSVPEHFAALKRLGPTIHHRRSFAPVAACYGELWPVEDCDAEPRCCLAQRLRAASFTDPLADRAMLRTDAPVSLSSNCCARARAWLFWAAALGAGVLWALVPSLFYSRAARPTAAGAGDRPRIAARHRSRPAARLLAGGDRVPPRRRVRRLSAVAGLRRRHLLGGVHARPPHRRRRARGAGGAADGRHFGVRRCRPRISAPASSRCRSGR